MSTTVLHIISRMITLTDRRLIKFVNVSSNSNTGKLSVRLLGPNGPSFLIEVENPFKIKLFIVILYGQAGYTIFNYFLQTRIGTVVK